VIPDPPSLTLRAGVGGPALSCWRQTRRSPSYARRRRGIGRGCGVAGRPGPPVSSSRSQASTA